MLAEAHYIHRTFLNFDDLCLVTWRSRIINHQKKIKKNLAGVHPAEPEKVFELHRDLILNFSNLGIKLQNAGFNTQLKHLLNNYADIVAQHL